MTQPADEHIGQGTQDDEPRLPLQRGGQRVLGGEALARALSVPDAAAAAVRQYTGEEVRRALASFAERATDDLDGPDIRLVDPADD